MKRYTFFLCLMLACWGCGGGDKPASTREWLPEPDLMERLRYQKHRLDSLGSDENAHSEIWVKYKDATPVRTELQDPAEDAETNYLLVRDESGNVVYAAEFNGNTAHMHTHYFDGEGNTFAFTRHRPLENGCKGKYVFESLTFYYDGQFKPVDKQRLLVDQNGQPVAAEACAPEDEELPEVPRDRDAYMKRHRLGDG